MPAPAISCDLPDIPEGVLPNVGFPDPDSIKVSRTDYAAMIDFVEKLRAWAQAADACMKAAQQ